MSSATNNHVFQFENGLVLLYEEMPWSESFAVGISVPAGSILDPIKLPGLANLTCEMTNRGAGEYDNRSLFEAMESLGVQSGERAGKLTANFSATGLRDNWERTLELLALQILNPRFACEEFEACQQIQLQEILSDEDEPDRKTYQAFNKIFLPGNLGNPLNGFQESVRKTTIDDVRKFHQEVYRPNGTVIAFTGRLHWEELKSKVYKLFGNWKPIELKEPELEPDVRSTIHIDSNTTQITFVLGSMDVPVTSPNYWSSLGGIKILGGGMSSRLFTEVREKRGLCYSVSASHCTLDKIGYAVFTCSTIAQNAQQSLDVIIGEIDRLRTESIPQNEVERVKIRLKSSLVMQRESTSRRVGALIGDWRAFKKIIPLEEDLRLLDSLTSNSIESYYANQPQKTFRLATLGPQQLSIPDNRLF